MKQISSKVVRKFNEGWFWREKTKNQRGLRFFTLLVDASQTNNTIICSHCVNISSNLSSESLVEALSIGEETNRITELNTMIKEESMSRTAGHTSISDLTTEAYNHSLGSVPPNKVQEIQIRTLSEFWSESLSSSFIWQSNNCDWTILIREQGSCGTSWAFTGTAGFESYRKRLYQYSSLSPNSVEQYLVSCDARFRGISFDICTAEISGGVGMIVGTCDPYIATYSSCKSLNPVTWNKASIGITRPQIGNIYSFPNDQIKTTVYIHGPTIVGLIVGSSFDANTGSVNHTVELVG